MLPDPHPSAPRPGKLLPGLLLLSGVFLGFLLLAFLNGMLLYPLAAVTFRPETARAARPWLAALSFVFAILEIVAYEWLRAGRIARLSQVSPDSRDSDNEHLSEPESFLCTAEKIRAALDLLQTEQRDPESWRHFVAMNGYLDKGELSAARWHLDQLLRRLPELRQRSGIR